MSLVLPNSNPYYLKLGSQRVSAGSFLQNEFLNDGYESVQLLTLDDSKLQHLQKLTQKNLRIYSRNVKWMFESLYNLDIEDKLLKYDPFRVGIYIAGPGYAAPWDVLRARREGHTISGAMRQFFNPKHGFKHNLGIAPAHISIQFGIMGPTNAFHNYPFGGQFALRKYQFDLEMDFVDAGLVIISNIYEDAMLVNFQNKSENRSTVLSEGVFARILEKKNFLNLDQIDFYKEEGINFGYLNFLAGKRPHE